jgi:hypothetical protein
MECEGSLLCLEEQATEALCNIHTMLVFMVRSITSFKNQGQFHTVTYSGCSIHDGNLLHSKSQYTTVKHSWQLSEHIYTSNPRSLGTLTPIEFFQQDLLWQSSNTHSHSCSHKATKHTRSGQSIVGLSVHLHTTTAPRRIVHR